ncbi:MAG: hypothetical protein A2X58_07170 [Nitrospirae bacterium GWC2_56_14]|nr:MAG: hypothetical protein A2X58_07170 [Nitrospirae bacterium GWC2_56_14]
MKLFFIAMGVAMILMVYTPRPSQAELYFGDALLLSEQPPSGHGGDHGKQGRRGSAQGHAEHRATAERTWYLNRHDLHTGAEARVLRSDGSQAAGVLTHGKDGWSFIVDTKPLDGSLDGVFTLSVIDRAVSDGILTVRAPKVNMINHSCGWGHTFKFDQERIKPKIDAALPLEIVAENLWDRNFHSKTMSGDRLVVQVLRYGKPAPNAAVSFTTGSGWTRTVAADEEGKASVQLIRDYYPETWSLFDARKQSTVLVTAVVEAPEKGAYLGQSYTRTRLVATLPWRYVPQRSEYTSSVYGLGIAALFAVASGAGIYAYRERRKRPCREVTFDERT